MDPDRPGVFSKYRNRPGDPTSLSANGILTIHEDENEILWLGTTNGLNRLDPRTGIARAYFVADGLPSNTIYRIQRDHTGKLWISTPRGLVRFDRRTEKIEAFNRFDGLEVDDFRENCGLVFPDGRLAFGGAGGWISFEPTALVPDPTPPSMALTMLRLDHSPVGVKRTDPQSPLDETINATQTLQLPYHHRTIELRFSAMHYAAPEKNGYAFRLDDLDDDWNHVSYQNRRATYTRLDPGSYTFRVRGHNKDGVWSEEKRLTIVIPPPFWGSWWAYAVYAVIACATIGSFLLVVRQKLARQRSTLEHLRQVEKLKDAFNKELEDKVGERTRELMGTRRQLLDAARAAGMAEIASDVLHNVGNTLNSVRTSLHLIQERAEEKRILAMLDRVIQLLDEHEETVTVPLGPEAQNLTRILQKIHQKLSANQSEIADEGRAMFEKIQRIVASLQKQQEHAHIRRRRHEAHDPDALVREALHAARETTRGMARFVETERVPRVDVDRLELLRVLSALIHNAVEAIEARGDSLPGKIVITNRSRGDGVVMEIRDNGIGIPHEDLSRLYVHGFTTKEQREGFGLHFAAISIKEMGGKIDVSSAGLGKGCVVRLELPRARAVIEELSTAS